MTQQKAGDASASRGPVGRLLGGTRVLTVLVGRPFGSARVLTVLVTVLALLAAAGLVGSAAYGWRVYQHHRTDQNRAAAVRAAKSTVTDLMSVSADTVDDDIKQTLSGATGEFAKQYKSGSDKVKSAVTKNKVRAKAKVLRVGVTDLSDKSATVLLSMDATVHNVNAPDGRRSHYRVRAVLARKHDKWLVSKVEFVG